MKFDTIIIGGGLSGLTAGLRLQQKGQKTAIILGNEVFGVSDKLLPLVDGAIEIPQFGTKHSFNVTIAAGMVMWEIFKQLTVDN